MYPIPKIICSSFHYKYEDIRRLCIVADHIPANYTHTVQSPAPNWSHTYHVMYRNVRTNEDEGCKKAVAFVEAIALIITPVFVVMVTSTILIVSLKRRLCRSDVILRSVQTVVIMTIGFNICVLPYSLTVGISPATIGPNGMLVLIFLMHVHSLINPIIFLTRSSKFRRQLLLLVNTGYVSFNRIIHANRKKVGEAINDGCDN